MRRSVRHNETSRGQCVRRTRCSRWCSAAARRGAGGRERGAADPREASFQRLFEEFSAPIYNYVLRMVADPIAPPTSRRTRSSRPTESSTR
jgi:hypothetical protein